VELRGFGALSVKIREARRHHNPKTRVVISVPETHLPVFRTGKEMKARLNGTPGSALRAAFQVVVLIARFVAVLRSVVGFIAGANQMPFANFTIANSAGAVAWALFYGLGAYYFGKGVEELARPFAMALAVIGAIVVVSMILYWRLKEQELAAAAERDIPGSLQAEQSGEADG
jgi:hypothetical protein